MSITNCQNRECPICTKIFSDALESVKIYQTDWPLCNKCGLEETACICSSYDLEGSEL